MAVNIKINEALSLIKQSKIVKLYEYYDGIQLTLDNLEYLIEIEDDDLYVVYTPSIIKEISEGVVEFSYTTRFPEILHNEFLVVPSTLKTLELYCLDNIKKGQLNGIQKLSLCYFNVNDNEISLLPSELSVLNIEVCVIKDHLKFKMPRFDYPFLEINIEEFEEHA